MIDETRLIHATIVASNTLTEILGSVNKKIAIEDYARRNQPAFVLHSQNEMIDSNFRHLHHVPTKSPSKNDEQPCRIPLDSMMSVTFVEESTSKASESRITRTITQQSKKLQIKKRQSINSSNYGQSYKSSARKQIVKRFQPISKELNTQEDLQLSRLRQIKEHQEFLQLNQKTIVRPKRQCKLQKGQGIVFDYEGNFSKRKEIFNKYFNNSLIQGNVKEDRDSKQNGSVSRQQPQKEAQSIQIASTRRGQNKLKSSLAGKEITFRTDNYSNEILKSIQIKQPGIKVTLDGQVAQVSQELRQKNNKDSRATQKAQTIQMKKINLNSNQRFKTEVLPQSSNIIDLPDTKRYSSRLKARSGMQKSMARPSAADKISVENCFLQKMILDSQKEVEANYKQLPTNRSRRRRVKTNIQKESQRNNQHLQKLQIKQRLINSTRYGDKLPRIISQHKRAQIEILRQVRQKKFIF